MSDLQPFLDTELRVHSTWLEQILLDIFDQFDIRISWNMDTAILTGAFALAGGLIGGYAGGKLWAAVGTGAGGVTGFGVATVVSLKQIWNTVKDKLQELFFIILNYLRRIDPKDYMKAFEILMACASSRRELVLTLLDFIAQKLGREVFSNITNV